MTGYDTWSPYDPSQEDSAEAAARLREGLPRDQEIVRAILPRLRREIENPDRDEESVFQ